MKVILHCNIIISAGLNPGTCRDLIDQVVAIHHIFLSQGIIQEYYEVISRAKFKPENVTKCKLILSDILEVATIIEPAQGSFNLLDPKDEIYLATALAAKADALITGDHKHFPLSQYEGILILSPGEFLKEAT
ncbi:MAG: putative toxin-antitoxin system toxin component, PIN family [Nitrospirae bacterium]|nr:putative toxin-antitoxin system toxin component, PIN family [Nitrospirota bacterium]